MIYSLEFKKEALKEWKKLDYTLQEQFKKKLEKILHNPHIPSARLSGFGINACYKIKLKQSGYRLVYKVIDERLIVTIVGVGKREDNKIYRMAMQRIKQT